MPNVFVVRQPVFDSSLNVAGYDLLYTSYEAGNPDFADEEKLTTHQILDTFVDIGLDRLVGENLAFINLTHSFILKRHIIPFPPQRVVLKVLSSITDQEVVFGIRTLSRNGYRISLECVSELREIIPLLPNVHFLRINIEEYDPNRLKQLVLLVRKYGIRLWANSIRTRDTFNHCKAYGFELFQGDFINQPQIVRGKAVPEMSHSLLMLLNKLQSLNTSFDELEEIVARDVFLSFKFMRIINSPLYAAAGRIHSIHQGLVYLGFKGIQNWASLMFIVRTQNKPPELINRTLFRAKMCELLAGGVEGVEPESAFTMGLFSLIDSLLDAPMNGILESLPFDEELATALLKKEGPLGRIIKCVIACERAEWKEVIPLGFAPETIKSAYLGAIDWMKMVSILLREEQPESPPPAGDG